MTCKITKTKTKTMTHGVYPVVHTPLHEDESIDFEGLKACLEYYNQTDLPGVTLLGSGGELPYFSDSEQYDIIKAAFNYLDGSKVIIAGVHAYSSTQAIEKIASYSAYVDYILLLVPDYYQSTFEDYLQTLECIAQHSAKPILFYYFPQITQKSFTSNQLIAILSIDNIIGIKDSSVHIPTAKRILSDVPDTLYFSGLSLLLEPLIKLGAVGAICPIASVLPQQAHEYFCAIQNSDKNLKKYRAPLKRMLPIVNTLTLSEKTQFLALSLLSTSPVKLIKNVTSSHAKIKEALRFKGLPIQRTVRAPLPGLSDTEAEKIALIMDDLASL